MILHRQWNRLPNYQRAFNPFPANLAPQLVLEVAVSNETTPSLVDVDLVNYFAPGTGTRAWIDLKVFKLSLPNGTYRWWAGWARRRMVNGQVVDQPDLSLEKHGHK